MGKFPQTKSFYLETFLIGTIFSIITNIYIGKRAAASMMFGSTFGILIFFLIDIAARGYFKKKSVAITGSVIVFKYAILGIILYLAMNTELVHKVGFLVGFLSFIPGTILWVMKIKKA